MFGNLYLTEKSGASDFTAQDEEIVVALAAAAGVVIENARLYEETQRRERWLVTTAAITSQVAASSNYEDVLTEVADRARAAASADEAWVLSGSEPGEVVASSGSPVGVPAWLAEASAGSAGASAALDPCPWLRVPLGGDRVGRPLTLVLAWSTERQDAFDEVDQSLAESFAEQVALAIEVSQRREVDERMAVLEDRDRIGRDLHDLVIQRLFAVGLGLESTA